MKQMKVWGGVWANHWKKLLGEAAQCRLIVKAHSRAEAVRVLNEVCKLTTSANYFRDFFSESGNPRDLVLCDGDWITVWVYNDNVCLRVYDARNPSEVRECR
jgi:hypothetical protein